MTKNDGEAAWRARSASDKTDDWPFWYVTDDRPADRNATLDALEKLTSVRPVGLPFVSRADAEQMVTELSATEAPAQPDLIPRADVHKLPPHIIVREARTVEDHIVISNTQKDDADMGLCLIPNSSLPALIAFLTAWEASHG